MKLNDNCPSIKEYKNKRCLFRHSHSQDKKDYDVHYGHDSNCIIGTWARKGYDTADHADCLRVTCSDQETLRVHIDGDYHIVCK